MQFGLGSAIRKSKIDCAPLRVKAHRYCNGFEHGRLTRRIFAYQERTPRAQSKFSTKRGDSRNSERVRIEGRNAIDQELKARDVAHRSVRAFETTYLDHEL